MAKLIWAAAAAALMLTAAPSVAQNANPWKGGNYWDVSGIRVKDGYGLTYAKFLADTWQRNQEFAKSKGWIKGYHVLSNAYPRDGEPHLYLVIVYDHVPNADEEDKRSEEYRAFMKRSQEQLAAASGERAEYRTNVGDMLLQEMVRR